MSRFQKRAFLLVFFFAVLL